VTPTPADLPTVAGARVLVVEDESIIARDIEVSLRDLGYSVCDTADNGPEAIEKAIQTRPDAVLMDVRLRGGMDGVMAAQQIRDRLSVPVVFLTAYADEPTLRRAEATQPFGYVLKPFDDRDLHVALVMALCRHRAYSEVERKVAERTAQLEATFQAMRDGVMAFNMDGDPVLVNQAQAEINGFDSVDEMKRNLSYFAEVYEIASPDGTLVPVDQWPVSRVLRGETLYDWELRGRRRDTGREWFFSFSGTPVQDATGKQVLALIITRDITERKQIEEALRESERRFRFLADNLPQIVWTANPDGYTDYYNERWYEFTGVERGGGGDESFTPVLHPDDVPGCLQTWRRSVQTGEPYNIEYRFKDRRTGTYRWFLGRALPLRNSRGRVVKWFGTCTDIQSQKESEQRLSDALRVREDFLAIAGHELKTPLAALLMHVQGLERAAQKDESASRWKERLSKASAAGFRLEKLIDDMLDVTRITAGRLRLQPEPTDLDVLVREVVERFAEQAARTQSPISLWAEARVSGLWDRLRLDQVITNLVSNALKYGKGKPVEIEVREEMGRALVRVRDHGIGIDPDQQRKIFQRFERVVAPREYGGFGLGLWISRQIVEASGGQIEVESTLGDGATFTLSLPVRPQESFHAFG
jgi:PAS domain S-box-containing protein